MSDLWYIKDHGREMGPMGFLFLKILAEEGKITPDTPVRREDGPWTPARQVEGVFEKTAGPASASRKAASQGSATVPLPPPRSASQGAGAGRWIIWVAIFIVLGVLRSGCRSDRSAYRVPPPRFQAPVQPWPNDDLRKFLEDKEPPVEILHPRPDLEKARQELQEALEQLKKEKRPEPIPEPKVVPDEDD
jgi:hypothetical protein